ncbi:MAG: glycosyltransferase family 39 protein, partial [Saprospiraceae bacterium]|nr:glycosyltransferase family 39 protein [Saprospiraceae bacterium]
MAKNLTSNYLEPTLYKDPILPFDFKAWNRNHIWLHKPPLTLWFMSASISVFGNTEFAVRLPSLIFSLLSIVLSFKIILKLFDLKTALIVAYFQS